MPGDRVAQPARSEAGWWVPALAGAVAFWLANLAISITAVAAAYRSAMSIDYVPMILEAAVGGLLVSVAVSFLLARFPERIPGGGPIRKALLLAAGALILLTLLVEVPAKVRSGAADSGHWLLVATVFNAIRVLALGVTVGIATRLSTNTRGRSRQEARS